MLQRSGYSVITLCNPNEYERLGLLGAKFCLNYKDPEAAQKIRELTANKLRYAWDTIGLESSAKICAECLSTNPGSRYGATNPIQSPRKDVESSSVVMYTMYGEPFVFGSQKFAGSQEDFEFAKMFMELTEKLLEEV